MDKRCFKWSSVPARRIKVFCLWSLLLGLASSSCIEPWQWGSGSSLVKLEGTDPSGLELSADLPVNPGLRTGTLDNGITWYIYPAPDSGGTLSLRLLVEAGSVNESPDQIGAAHFVEHMAFNGTLHFPGDIQIKAGFQEQKNGYTGFDATVFTQDIPANDTGLLNQSLLLFQDYAQGLLFEPQAMENERKVILEEWRRTYRGAQGIVDDLKLAFEGSPYKDRMPISSEDDISALSLDEAKSFYDTWYQPRRMKVIIAGPCDPDVVQGLIKDYLGPVEARSQDSAVTEAPEPVLPERLDTKFSVTTWSVSPPGLFLFLKPWAAFPGHTVGKLKAELTSQVLAAAYQHRFSRLASLGLAQLCSPFLRLEPGLRVKGKDFYTWGVQVRDGDMQESFKAFVQENQRILRSGFDELEFQAALRQVRQDLKAKSDAATKLSGSDLAGKLLAHAFYGDLFLAPDLEFQVADKILNALDLGTLNKAARFWLDDNRTAAWIRVPPEYGYLSAPVFQIALANARNAKLPALEKPVQEAGLAQAFPQGGRILSEETLDGIATQVWTLSNGARVYWRKMDGSKRLVLRAARLGGLGAVPDGQIPSARVLGELQGASGLGNLDAEEFKTWLASRSIPLAYWLDDCSSGYTASAREEQLEDLFQVVYQEALVKEFSAGSFERSKANLLSQLASAEANWTLALSNHVMDLRAQGNARLEALGYTSIKNMDLATCGKLWHMLYGNAQGYVFVLCGNADPEKVKDLVARYLAAIPGQALPDKQYAQSWSQPGGGINARYQMKGLGASRVHLECSGLDDPYPGQNGFVLETVRIILQNRIFALVREKMGGTYDPLISSTHQGWPQSRWILSMDFACAQGREDELIQAIKDEMHRIAAQPLSQAELETYKETLAYSSNSLTFGYENWAAQLEYQALRGLDPTEIPYIPSRVDELTIPLIKEWMQKNLLQENWFQVVLSGT